MLIMNRLLFISLIVISACSSKNLMEPSRAQLTKWLCDYGDHFEKVNIPHTPKLEPLVVNNQWQGKLAYTKRLKIENPQKGRTWLHFEGVMNKAKVYVNGASVTEHVGGYLPFTVDITNFIQQGDNEVRVEVTNTDNSVIPPGKPLKDLDFNFYGGIYRDVWLVRKNNVYITDPFIENTKDAGWQVHFNKVEQKNAVGDLKIHLKNDGETEQTITVMASLSIQNEAIYNSQKQVSIQAGETSLIELPLALEAPELWSTINPNLYNLEIGIQDQSGILLDQVEDKIGIRKIELNEDGFFLNGEKLFIRGTNRHQEYPYVGYAISDNANYRDALKIKNAGFDLVRLSHYPQDESFLEACDELGLLVMNAIPGWQFYEEGEFVANSYQDIKDMVRRDRNHPSVVFWEVSLNESGMTDSYMREANRILKEELPFEDTYSAGWIDHPAYDLFIPARQHAGPPDYWNEYKEGKRQTFIAEYGDWEYYAHNAGFNQTAFGDLSEEARNSRQLRSDGERRLLQQALNFQEAANSNRRGSGTIGHANWLMFDYNRGYADDLEASGISDIFRIPKFAYYFYKSQRPADELIDHPLVEAGPMVKIASYWTENSPTNVTVYSNCEEIALYLNDSLVGKKSPKISAISDELLSPPFQFDLGEFQSGKLTARGYIDRKVVATDSVSTPGKAHAIQLSVDYTSDFTNEDDDLIFVYAKVVDSFGVIVPNDTSEILFKLTSQGELIDDNPSRAEAGIATILYRGDYDSLKIEASASQLIPATHQNSVLVDKVTLNRQVNSRGAPVGDL